jgi:tRNA(Ile)-lysidine synthase
MRRRSELEEEVRKTIQKFEMLRAGEHVLVGVSGGADSMALLHVLTRIAPDMGLTLTAAHLNHGVRGAESDADQEFVAETCRRLGVRLVAERARFGSTGANFEERARRARYDFLRRTAIEAPAHKIAVGHTMNDQAETVLLRLFRGSGADGLSAIHPVVDGTLVRPLLYCTRDQVITYLRSAGATWREDASNQDISYRRNRIRHELIPLLARHYNSGIVRTLAREADLSRETAGFLNRSARIEYTRLLRRSRPGEVTLDVPELRITDPALRKWVIRQALRDASGSIAGIAAGHIESVLRLLKKDAGGRTIQLPGGRTVSQEFETLRICSAPPRDTSPFSYALPVPGECKIQEAALSISATVLDGCCKLGDPKRQAVLDAESVPGRLTVRSRQPGDRYGGPTHRKVKKMLIDAHIPRADRDLLPMVVFGDSVVWVPGFRPAKSFAVQPNSSRCIVLEARKSNHKDREDGEG